MSRPPTQYENHLQFAEFANALRMLETTSGRRQTITLLAGLFHRAAQDVHILPYLLQGRLGPPFAAPDLGINERGIAQAIADMTGHQVAEVWQEYRRQGDLGVVAEQLLATRNALPEARTTKSAGHALSVQQVHAELVTITTASGKGGRTRKVGACMTCFGTCFGTCTAPKPAM